MSRPSLQDTPLHGEVQAPDGDRSERLGLDEDTWLERPGGAPARDGDEPALAVKDVNGRQWRLRHGRRRRRLLPRLRELVTRR